MRIDIITIFPGYFGPLGMSLIGKAADRGDIEFGLHDLRTWARDVHHTVDDTPYGGGPGMVMKPEPWGEALDAVLPPGTRPPEPSGQQPVRLVVPAASGRLFTQELAVGYARMEHVIFACGRYEGIDARVIDEARERVTVNEVSIGDYVLAGGESAALVMIESICRLLPGVLGNEQSAADDSFGGGPDSEMTGLLEGPVYIGPASGAIARSRRCCCPGTTRPSRGGVATPRCDGRRESARTWRPGWNGSTREGPAGAVGGWLSG